MNRELVRPTDFQEPTYECLDCKDEPNGWRMWWCPGVELAGRAQPDDITARHSCGRTMAHAPHSYADRCPCLPTNQTIQRAKERMNAARIKKAK